VEGGRSDLLEKLGSCAGLQWVPPQYDLLLRPYILRAIQLSVSCRKSVQLHCTNVVTISVSRLVVQCRSGWLSCSDGSLFSDDVFGVWINVLHVTVERLTLLLDIRKVPAPVCVEISWTDTGVSIPTLECHDVACQVGQLVVFQISKCNSDSEHN